MIQDQKLESTHKVSSRIARRREASGAASEEPRRGKMQAEPSMEAMAIVDEYRELDSHSKLLHPTRYICTSPSARLGVDRPLKIDDFQRRRGR